MDIIIIFQHIIVVVKKNRNGTNKEIDYKRGKYCFFPTEKRYWKPYAKISKKTKTRRVVKFTRYMSNLGINFYAKTKKRMWYDYSKKCFRPRSEWYKNNDPFLNMPYKLPLVISRRAFDLSCTDSGQLML